MVGASIAPEHSGWRASFETKDPLIRSIAFFCEELQRRHVELRLMDSIEMATDTEHLFAQTGRRWADEAASPSGVLQRLCLPAWRRQHTRKFDSAFPLLPLPHCAVARAASSGRPEFLARYWSNRWTNGKPGES